MRTVGSSLSLLALLTAASCALPAYVFDADDDAATGGTGSGGAPGGAGGAGASDGAGGAGADGGSGGGEVLGPFDTPVKIISLATAGKEDDPTMTDDGLELYFNRDDAAILRARRDDPSEVWGAPAVIPELEALGDALDHPVISPDGLTLWLSRAPAGERDIYVTKRAAPGDPWPEPLRVAELSSNSTDAPCSVDAEGKIFILMSNRSNGQGGKDLWVSFRDDAGAPWGSPANLMAINSGDDEVSGWLSPAATELFFATTRDNRSSIMETSTTDTLQTFEEPARLDELEQPSTMQSDPWLSSDQRYIVFVRDEGGNEDLWEARR